ncbi:MAG TPA: uroporphyrinogen-III C-methyltransferase [Acidimicrobiales bacterium]|nr:uroporphyrinogen-III C-methyltransferase [Acidimicrobiales bacterium]
MTVHLVGAGPGDPELITVRGARLIATADVILHDRLAEPLLALAGADAEIIDVGKAPGSAPTSQDDINALLVEHGRRHDTVVRLKGGDPYIFARGAEEVEALRAAGVDYAVVPGISSVLAAPTAAGAPLTCRGVTRTFTVLSGHEEPDAWAPGYAEALVALGGTIVVMMGAARMARIATHLIAAGADPTTPVAAAKSVTTPDEVIARATLGDVEPALLASPTVFVIGQVAAIDLR